jgi:hypothetical protein
MEMEGKWENHCIKYQGNRREGILAILSAARLPLPIFPKNKKAIFMVVRDGMVLLI